jgi:hypothetical protein
VRAVLTISNQSFRRSCPGLPVASNKLREREYDAVILDQFLMKAEPEESDQLLQHLGTATPVYVNFAISGVERVVRETRTSLARRQREEQVARKSAERARLE